MSTLPTPNVVPVMTSHFGFSRMIANYSIRVHSTFSIRVHSTFFTWDFSVGARTSGSE